MTTGHIDPSRLQQSLDALRERDFTNDLPRSMEALVSAARDLFSVTGAGLLLADADRVLRYVAATDQAARILEEAQEQAGTGPCVESLVLNQLVQTTDLPSDPRWPGLLSDYPEAGIRAVLGVPVRVAGVAVGSLNVYSDEPFDWDESDQKALAPTRTSPRARWSGPSTPMSRDGSCSSSKERSRAAWSSNVPWGS